MPKLIRGPRHPGFCPALHCTALPASIGKLPSCDPGLDESVGGVRVGFNTGSPPTPPVCWQLHPCLSVGNCAPRSVSHQGLHAVWQRPMFMYHVRLWRFLKLVETAMEEKVGWGVCSGVGWGSKCRAAK